MVRVFLELSNSDIYVGSTNDLKRGFSAHQAGEVVSTKPYRPVKLRSYVAVEAEQHARELERYFKSASGKAVALRRLIRRTSLVEDKTPETAGETDTSERNEP